MLDSDTKRRIDTCRDILVGKVPDPKSQVEQITIALIYKFMDDMDAEAEELGGKRTFFAGEYDKFGWSKLMAPSMGGFDVLALYSEAIQKMNENPGIPALFRDIFKNAYLPYRDPETLRSFLKEIDSFTYDHSERLGDAFEYLLSVLGSQGDAGQFRTPRHIIDFMVEITDPKKGESILDPACGTAGFLISAWKHILKTNTKTRSGDLLTPDERKYLAANISGYDISPDMVRLSLVNMYLHGFTDPHIVEYDTLTSEEKWNEHADVILANPPFMSPKGGIKPHKRFSVQATRSEVLFVDYMAEHLTPNGRAAIIVPEGIIFQSQTAYKQLRKMLVDSSLVAVVSLPAGVFQPYSGVKTSILVMDKSLAKRCDSVLFVKVANDGFGLGAQRRVVTGSDLPDVVTSVKQWLHSLRSGDTSTFDESNTCLIVTKAKIAANGEYNLSGERYRATVACLSTFPLVPIEGLFTKIGNGVNVAQLDDAGKYRVSRIQTIADGSVNLEKTKFTNDEVKPESFLQSGDILLSHINSVDHLGKTAIFPENVTDVIHGINLIRLVADKTCIDPRYAIRVFKTDRFTDIVKSFAQKAVNQASVKTSDLRAIQIPLPPLDVQQEIVSEIEGYQKIIDGARAVIDNYRPHISINSEWPMRAISEVSIKITKGSSPTWQGISYTTQDEGVLFVTSENVGLGHLLLDKPKYVERRFNEIEPKSILQKGDVLTNIVGASIGRTAIFNLDLTANVNQAVCVIRPNTALVDSIYLMSLLNSPEFIQSLLGNSVENARANVSMGVLGSLTIPLPPLATQQAIVAEIEAEQALVNANRELITRFEKKIQATLARVWGEDAV